METQATVAERAAAKHATALWLLGLGAIAAVAAPVALWRTTYSGPLIWPGLAANFAATFAAFVVALSWDRRERHRERLDDESERLEALAAREEDELARRVTEARRRFAAIKTELEKDLDSVEEVRRGLSGRIVLPQLLTGSWRASAAPLSLVVADYELMAALATCYGRLEELQWRLRFRLEAPDLQPDLDAMTSPLAEELGAEIRGLISRVDSQVHDPDVQERGLLHRDSATILVRVTGQAEAATATSGD